MDRQLHPFETLQATGQPDPLGDTAFDAAFEEAPAQPKPQRLLQPLQSLPDAQANATGVQPLPRQAIEPA
jgi:hypothetical protein